MLQFIILAILFVLPFSALVFWADAQDVQDRSRFDILLEEEGFYNRKSINYLSGNAWENAVKKLTTEIYQNILVEEKELEDRKTT